MLVESFAVRRRDIPTVVNKVASDRQVGPHHALSVSREGESIYRRLEDQSTPFDC